MWTISTWSMPRSSPSSAGINPSLTIAANALRVADAIGRAMAQGVHCRDERNRMPDLRLPQRRARRGRARGLPRQHRALQRGLAPPVEVSALRQHPQHRPGGLRRPLSRLPAQSAPPGRVRARNAAQPLRRLEHTPGSPGTRPSSTTAAATGCSSTTSGSAATPTSMATTPCPRVRACRPEGSSTAWSPTTLIEHVADPRATIADFSRAGASERSCSTSARRIPSRCAWTTSNRISCVCISPSTA